jgi:hypothetical protein
MLRTGDPPMSHQRRRLAANTLAVLCLSFASVVSASAQDMWTAFDSTRVQELLKKIGAQSVSLEKSTAGGTTTDVIVFQSGETKFLAMPAVCKANGCLALSLGVAWKNDIKLTAEIVNEFNLASEFGRAFVTEDGEFVGYGRYAIADGGVSEANVVSNIVNFVGNAEEFLKFANKARVVAMGPGAPSLLAARQGLRWPPEFAPMASRALAHRAVNDMRRIVRPLAPSAHGPAR